MALSCALRTGRFLLGYTQKGKKNGRHCRTQIVYQKCDVEAANCKERFAVVIDTTATFELPSDTTVGDEIDNAARVVDREFAHSAFVVAIGTMSDGGLLTANRDVSRRKTPKTNAPSAPRFVASPKKIGELPL